MGRKRKKEKGIRFKGREGKKKERAGIFYPY